MYNECFLRYNSFILHTFHPDTLYIVTCMSDYKWSFGLDIGFIDHFNTQLVITLNYGAISNFHILHTRSLFQPTVPSLVVAW
jgi:hypothetical protein